MLIFQINLPAIQALLNTVLKCVGTPGFNNSGTDSSLTRNKSDENVTEEDTVPLQKVRQNNSTIEHTELFQLKTR